MTNTVIYNLMKNLIGKKFYDTKEDAVEKLGVYYAFNMLTYDQMMELALLAEEAYMPEPVPEEPQPEPTPEETPVE